MKALLLVAALTVAAFGFADDCKTAKACCNDKAPMSAEKKDAEFLREAQMMAAAAEGKQACCQTTATKVVAKGEAGCCNAPTEIAKFKVFVAGQGYKFFGCADSAAEGRKSLVAKGIKVGSVQPVKSKITIG